MKRYKYYSFDLWLTLIKSNPIFKKKRVDFFYSELNIGNNSWEEVEKIFRKVDLMCNSINQQVGKNIDAFEMYLMVLYLLNPKENCFDNINVEAIYSEVDSIFFNYLPVVCTKECFTVLNTLKEEGATLNILSNTGFIKGISVRKALKIIGLEDFFAFQIYSDEVGLSKPNRRIFEHLIAALWKRTRSKISLKEIVHIGDNPLADITGAKSVGLDSVLINSNNISITTLLT